MMKSCLPTAAESAMPKVENVRAQPKTSAAIRRALWSGEEVARAIRCLEFNSSLKGAAASGDWLDGRRAGLQANCVSWHEGCRHPAAVKTQTRMMLSRTLLSPSFSLFLAKAIPTLVFGGPRSTAHSSFFPSPPSPSLSLFLCIPPAAQPLPSARWSCHRRHVDIATRHLALGATRSRSTIHARAINTIPRRPRSTILRLASIRHNAGARPGDSTLARLFLLLGQPRQALDRGRQHKADPHGHLPHLPAHRSLLVHQGLARQDLRTSRRVSQPANKALRTQSRSRCRRRSLQVRHPPLPPASALSPRQQAAAPAKAVSRPSPAPCFFLLFLLLLQHSCAGSISNHTRRRHRAALLDRRRAHAAQSDCRRARVRTLPHQLARNVAPAFARLPSAPRTLARLAQLLVGVPIRTNPRQCLAQTTRAGRLRRIPLAHRSLLHSRHSARRRQASVQPPRLRC